MQDHVFEEGDIWSDGDSLWQLKDNHWHYLGDISFPYDWDNVHKIECSDRCIMKKIGMRA